MTLHYLPAGSALLLALGSLIAPVTAAVVDTFSDNSLSEYTSTRVLDNGAASTDITFSSATGGLVATYGTGAAQAEQVLLLRNDVGLGVGQTLRVDTAIGTTTTAMDFGLAIASTATPTSASVSDTDTRDLVNFLAIYVRPSQDAVRVTSSNGGVVTTATGVLGTAETLVSQLYITRVTSTQFTVGYLDTSAVSHDALTINFTATNVGDAIGFYADLRATSTNLGTLDNLAIVPEPGAALLGAFGLVGIMRRRRL